jgi:prephenate dehydratase
VAHYLFAPPGFQAADLTEIHSHPQALAQCRPFLQKNFPEITEVPQHSTAGAAAEVARLGGRRGALGPRRSGDIYGLKMLLPALSLADGNKTRFVLVGREDAPPTGRDKTSLLFTVEAGPGRLHRVLALFAAETIDLCKIESRPTKKELGEYMFFLDFSGHRLEGRAAAVLRGVQQVTPFLKILGSYPAAQNDV